MSNIYLEDFNGKKVLIVKDEPFVMISGEVHNSSSSSAQYIEKVWDQAKALGMNSLLLPVTWEMVEPEEGVLDFSLVDQLIFQARSRDMKICFLWFGAWKNAQCYYAPPWVKTDLERFKRAEVAKGKNGIILTKVFDLFDLSYSSLSYLCSTTNECETKTLKKLMNHIKEVDEQEKTVVMIQIENETGLLYSAREHSDLADELFDSDVPQQFVDYMKNHVDTMVPDVREQVEAGAEQGNWSAVFGSAAEEIFSAYHIANYVDRVAAAGKEIYSIPMVVNCWLNKKGEVAGQYPSGGPVSRMMEVWRYAAPVIDIFAPDIYIADFCGVCDEYTRRGNPLFIPETSTHSYAGPRLVYSVGHYHALGFSPFGFEEMGEPISVVAGSLFGMETTDPALAIPQDVEEYGWFGRTLNSMMPMLTQKYGTKDLQASCYERKDDNTMLFGDLGFSISYESPLLSRKDGVCLILKESEDEFFIIANGCVVKPFSTIEGKPYMDILVCEEGAFENGKWTMTRRLNGDEIALLFYNKPTLLKVKLFAYK